MVRRIQCCPRCQRRFVSRLTAETQCNRCPQPTVVSESKSEVRLSSGEHGEDQSPALKRLKASPHEALEPPSENNDAQILEIQDGASSSSGEESADSEGMDDFQCTQLQGDDQEDNGDDQWRTYDIHDDDDNVTSNRVTPTATSCTDDLNNNMCFICGSSLDGLKGRLNHIKRCAKKHRITGMDVRLNDDEDAFVFQTNNTAKAVGAKSSDDEKLSVANNPYSKQPKRTWHGSAEKDLQLASTASADTQSSKQTALTSFFKTPMRSLNNVLVANAKRVAKTGGIMAAAKASAGKEGKGRRRWGQEAAKRSCPQYKIITGTNFVVDGFTYARPTLTKNYFLTHFHSDHYGGLTRNWDKGTIYCSLITANLVHERLGVDMQYLHPIGLHTPTVVESNGRPITVTLFDANHCPGAAVFLFQIGKRTILHVGDFRWHQERLKPVIREVSKQPQLDELFLDTTYCHEKYTLPSQDIAIKATVECAVKEFQQSRDKGERMLLVFGAYTIGKEKIYLSVAERLRLKIYVDTQRYKVLSALKWPEERMALLTTKRDEAIIWVVPLLHVNMKRLQPYLYGLSQAKHPVRKYDRVIGFRPTGWSNTPGNSVVSSRTSGRLTVHSVPYSEHSSFTELLDCLKTLKPKTITPTVSVSKSQQQVDLLLRNLNIRQQLLT